jgi:5-methylcytosine-specific restriction protein A
MPNAMQRPCAYPGCDALVDKGYCAVHIQARVTEYVRDPRIQSLYNDPRWIKRRALQLAQEPWCIECLGQQIYTPATDADHIEPHHGDPIKFFTGALQSMCHSHHAMKTRLEGQLRGEGA